MRLDCGQPAAELEPVRSEAVESAPDETAVQPPCGRRGQCAQPKDSVAPGGFATGCRPAAGAYRSNGSACQERSARNEPLDSGRSRTDHGLSAIIPLPRLPALAELSLFGVFVSTLQQIVKGSLLLGPLFAFAIAQSPLTLFGFGPFLGAGIGYWCLAPTRA